MYTHTYALWGRSIGGAQTGVGGGRGVGGGGVNRFWLSTQITVSTQVIRFHDETRDNQLPL